MKARLSERDDLVRQILNRCLIYLIINGHKDAEKLIPTLLEDNYEDCQEIIDKFCIRRA